MKAGLVAFLVGLLLFLLLAYPFKINFKLHINFINLKSFYSLKVLFIKLLCGTTYIEQNNLIIQNTHNLVYNSSKDAQKQMREMTNIAKKIEISKVQIFFTGGIEDNAYQTAMICGYMYAISSALISYIITTNPYVDIFQDIDPVYNKNALDLTAKCILKISILDILIALLESRKQFKENKDGKKA